MERKQKKRNAKKVLLCICGCVVLAVVIAVGVSFANHSAAEKKAVQDLPALDACYAPIMDCVENGFNKETAAENKEIFKKALDNGVSKELFEKSKFYDAAISFSSSEPLPTPRNTLKAHHCRDLVLSMYLACVLATEPDQLKTELRLLSDGNWATTLQPEFIDLLAEKYPFTETEMAVVNTAITDFADTIENPLDKFRTYNLVNALRSIYNEAHPGEVYTIKDIDTYTKTLIALMNQVPAYKQDWVWMGYGDSVPFWLFHYVLQYGG